MSVKKHLEMTIPVPWSASPATLSFQSLAAVFVVAGVTAIAAIAIGLVVINSQ